MSGCAAEDPGPGGRTTASTPSSWAGEQGIGVNSPGPDPAPWTPGRFRRLGIRLGLCCLVLLGCEGAGPPRALDSGRGPEGGRSRPGRLVLVGGALQDENTAVYRAILEGRRGEGPLCVLPTASGTPGSAIEGYVEAFDAVGGPGAAEGVYLTLDNREDAASEETVTRLKGCSGFFFTGGVQTRIAEVLLPGGHPSPAFEALRDRHQAGAVVSGSSAGAAIMSDPMIAGGNSREALWAGVRAEGGGEGDGLRMSSGFGFVEEGLVDQHFLARGRWGRLMVGILASGEKKIGLGIDENTALVVEADTAWVVGMSGVVYMDARDADPETGGNGGHGVRLFLLGDGDVLDLSSGRLRPAEGKIPVRRTGAPFAAEETDLFASWSFLRVLFALAVAQENRLAFHQDGHVLEIGKAPGFQARAWAEAGVHGTPSGLFVGPFVLNAWRE